MTMIKQVSPHFKEFLFDWNQKFQFLVGGYGSSKSYHVALKIVLKLLKEKRTALVIRELYDTHRDSTFSLFDELVSDLKLDHSLGVYLLLCRFDFQMAAASSLKGWISQPN